MTYQQHPAQLAIIPTPQGRLVLEEHFPGLVLCCAHESLDHYHGHALTPATARVLASLLMAAAQLQEIILDRAKTPV